MRNYKTSQGDTWDSIAFKVYGDEHQMNTLIDANSAHRETVLFPAGVTLTIPDVEVVATAPLPPWRRA